ncbi:hypothetical protein [Vulcanococcus limneticus]|uniref:hypothetical protein n=1 Tax=Vulcanococcus limneticus TaxID=2170428 RepID=UPI00398C0385
MQAGIDGYNATGCFHKGYNDKQHNDKECNNKEHDIDDNTGNNYTVDERSQSPARIDEDSNCLGKEPNSSPQARLSVGVPRGVYKQLKLLAHDRDMTVSALLVQLIKAEIRSDDAIDC